MRRPKAEDFKISQTKRGLDRFFLGLLHGKRGSLNLDKEEGNILDKLRVVGGPSHRTKSGIDATRAAERLGVSRRTVERWIAAASGGKGTKPSKVHAHSINTEVQKSLRRKTDRQQVVDTYLQRNKDLNRRDKSHLDVRGQMGLPGIAADDDYIRNRKISIEMDRDKRLALLHTYSQYGPKAARDLLSAYVNEHVKDMELFEVTDMSWSSNTRAASSRYAR